MSLDDTANEMRIASESAAITANTSDGGSAAGSVLVPVSSIQRKVAGLHSVTLGWLVSLEVDVAGESIAMVDFPGSLTGPQPARFAVPVTAEQVAEAITTRQSITLVFEDGEPSKPIVTGFITPIKSRPAAESEPMPPLEADVDGKRMRLSAEDEIVLECGQASVTLRRNGRVLIRGTYVETYSDGTNRIKGGQVQIN